MIVARVAVRRRSTGSAALLSRVSLVRRRVVLSAAAFAALLLGVALGDDGLLDVVDEEVEELVGIMLHVVVKVHWKKRGLELARSLKAVENMA